MNRLLAANFTRLKKDKVFWFGMIMMSALAAFFSINSYLNAKPYGVKPSIDNITFMYNSLFGIIPAVYCCLFIGTEYSDGTIRNKLAIGHRRSTVYISNFIVCTAAALLMCLSYIITTGLLSIFIMDPFQSDSRIILMYYGISLMMILAYSSVFTMISMLIQSKSTVAIISIIGFFLFFLASIMISTRLQAPEMLPGYTYDSNTEGYKETEPQKNPNFLEGKKRKLYEFAHDFLPTSQGIRLSDVYEQKMERLPFCSFFIIVVSFGTGYLVFQKKEIK